MVKLIQGKLVCEYKLIQFKYPAQELFNALYLFKINVFHDYSTIADFPRGELKITFRLSVVITLCSSCF